MRELPKKGDLFVMHSNCYCADCEIGERVPIWSIGTSALHFKDKHGKIFANGDTVDTVYRDVDELVWRSEHE